MNTKHETSVCRHCKQKFVPKPWQLAKSDFECDPCRKTRQAEWRLRRKEAGNPVVSGKMSREYHRAYASTYFEDEMNRERRNALMRGYAKAHGTAEHHKARRLVRTAIETGRMTRQPCEVCGTKPAQAHHDDYSKPLDVRWLCPTHHREHHAKATGASHEVTR
ncbi:hypothetical protein [Ralstonia chuxiongensis]|uniref:Uncharacterized protein n=1 Tax=Ralstonia chuxiongensis TaxID=2957504 RepID=A0AA41WWR6_9RALS|nr:hypothetical protein [Ralstonia chuxiongensis]MCP1173764.1 hypothetical protein [Ralstonia chuxiongensis]